MKHVVVLAILLLVPAAKARAQASAPSDTLPGRAHLVRHLSAAMCEQLTTRHRGASLSKLAPDSAQALLVRLSYHALMAYAPAVEQLVAASPNPDATGAGLVQEATLLLAEQCLAARPLLARVGMQYATQPTVVADAERPVLSAVAHSICQRLDAANARQPFDKLTPGERGRAIDAATSAAVLEHHQQLTAFYRASPPATDVQLRLKIGQLVLEKCPTYLLLVSRDVSAGQLPGPPPLALPGGAPPLDLPAPTPPATRPPR